MSPYKSRVPRFRGYNTRPHGDPHSVGISQKGSLFRSPSSLQRCNIAVSWGTASLLRKEGPKVCMIPVPPRTPRE